MRRRDGDDFEPFDDGRLGRAGAGYEQAAEPLCRRGHGHRQGPLRRPRRAVERQLADHRVSASRSDANWPARRRECPSAIGRSNDAACLGSSAGARLITTRSCGRMKPLLTIARAMRWVLSRTAASGRPTSTVLGIAVGETSTSTSTGKASIPNSENVRNVASMCKQPAEVNSEPGVQLGMNWQRGLATRLARGLATRARQTWHARLNTIQTISIQTHPTLPSSRTAKRAAGDAWKGTVRRVPFGGRTTGIPGDVAGFERFRVRLRSESRIEGRRWRGPGSGRRTPS